MQARVTSKALLSEQHGAGAKLNPYPAPHLCGLRFVMQKRNKASVSFRPLSFGHMVEQPRQSPNREMMSLKYSRRWRWPGED